MFSFAGIQLCETDDSEFGALIEAQVRPSELFTLSHRTWPGSLTDGPILDITPEVPRPVRINTLWWPWGASRFARAHFVVNDAQLAAIRQATQAQSTLKTETLTFDDGTKQLQTKMWPLPAWPLQQVGDGLNGWLLTLVDDRYWWWGVPLTLTVTEGTTTWTDLYASIASAIATYGPAPGFTITVDTIVSAYGTPMTDYTTGYRPLPAVLDAIAFSVQQRIIRSFAGIVTAQNSSTAYNNVVSQLPSITKPYAGGKFALVPG